MAYDQLLASRLREAFSRAPLSPNDDVLEKHMFGGIAFMVSGTMCVGVLGDLLIARCVPDDYARLLSPPTVRPMDFTGRPSKGFLYVEPPACATAPQLDAWLVTALRYVRSPEAAKKRASPKKPSSKKRPFPKKTGRPGR